MHSTIITKDKYVDNLLRDEKARLMPLLDLEKDRRVEAQGDFEYHQVDYGEDETSSTTRPVGLHKVHGRVSSLLHEGKGKGIARELV